MLKTEMENKKMSKATLTNKSGVPLHGVRPGDSKIIEVDNAGVPKGMHWRKRQRDAAIDGCVEIKTTKKTKPKKEES